MLASRLTALRKQHVDPIAGAIRRVLSSPDGTLLMAALEREFIFGRMLGDTPEQTALNLGAREVVLWLRSLRDYSQGQEKNDADQGPPR
jgi:hypothetical protein